MPHSSDPQKQRLAALSVAALGVVYGDIGTSPLYAMKEIFSNPHHPVPILPDNILGILSLIFWSLIVVVSIKYVALILRADNKGEGGIMALMALVIGRGMNEKKTRVVTLLGLFGAALFYGDGAITPAISVLSAVEGLEVATPAFKSFIIPITLVILIALFVSQRAGTARIGSLFGPITVLWFLVLAILGILNIAESPGVLKAVWPGYALGFVVEHKLLAFFALGAVFLALTGAEALYADMGHFGREPIRLAWFGLVLPSLVLNYFGQGALILNNPAAIQNPFYLMAPGWALYPLVGLATVATVIASQAVITGIYSMTQQAIQLGYSPRVRIQHTSSAAYGQIYVPGINWTLLVVVVALVVGFQSSTNLAAAYGIAVSGTMIITTLFAFLVARNHWQWSLPKAAAVFGVLLWIDGSFLTANAVKIFDGGWFPLVFGAVVFTLLTTWKRGRELLTSKLAADALPLKDFVQAIEQEGLPTAHGTAVFMTNRPDQVPHALLHNLKHNMVLHERVIVATVIVLPVPRAPDSQRLLVEHFSGRFHRVKIYYGFMEAPDVPAALEWCGAESLEIDPMTTSFFLGRETLRFQSGAGMALWRGKLFAAMFRNAGSVADYFKLPPNRVVELGSQVVL